MVVTWFPIPTVYQITLPPVATFQTYNTGKVIFKKKEHLFPMNTILLRRVAALAPVSPRALTGIRKVAHNAY